MKPVRPRTRDGAFAAAIDGLLPHGSGSHPNKLTGGDGDDRLTQRRQLLSGAGLVLAIILSAGLLQACEQPSKKTYGDEDGASTGGSTPVGGISGVGVSAASGQLVTVPVQLVNRQTGLNLASPTDAFSITLASCKTGYTNTADKDSSALQVYKYDRGCKAKLTSFEFNSIVYTPTGGDPFTTWDANDTAVFDDAGAPGPNAIFVKVISQLGDPIAGNEAVVYQFAEKIKGTDELVTETSTGSAHTLDVVGQEPPSFTIKSVNFAGVNMDGGGQFEFVMECTQMLDGVGTNECKGVDMSLITYRLVEDDFTDPDELTFAEANALFPAGQSTVTLPGDKVAPGALSTVNGGFITETLDGPDEMATGNHPHMILILQANGISYQYFNVDVATLTQD